MKTSRITLFIFLFATIVSPVFSQQKTDKVINEKMGKTLDQLKPEQIDAVLHQAVDIVSNEKKKAAIASLMSNLTPKEKQKLLDYAIMEKYGLNEKPKAHDHSSHAGHNHGAAKPQPSKVAPTFTPVGPTTTMDFDESVFDFGVIEEGEKISNKYRFTNTGKEPLIISNAKGSCGCTVPVWPKDPIAPGESAEILVEFNSKGKPGAQSKRVTITANTNPAQTFITIKGKVEKKQ